MLWLDLFKTSKLAYCIIIFILCMFLSLTVKKVLKNNAPEYEYHQSGGQQSESFASSVE
jgi:hypothetical protein